MVQINPWSTGPNLITEAAMRFIRGQPTGPGTTIKTYNGVEKMTGGEIEFSFFASGAGP